MAKARIAWVAAAGLVAAVTVGIAGAGEGVARDCPGKAGHSSMASQWSAADRDADGALSREEFAAALPGLASRFEALDHDGDGKLTSFEIHHPPGTARHATPSARPAGFETAVIRL